MVGETVKSSILRYGTWGERTVVHGNDLLTTVMISSRIFCLEPCDGATYLTVMEKLGREIGYRNWTEGWMATLTGDHWTCIRSAP